MADEKAPPPALLTPVLDDDGAPFWTYAARGELRVQACAEDACGELRFPPRPCCPHCHSFDTTWRRMSGKGRIWSYVIPHPPLLPAYAALCPYNAILVELTDAPRIRLVGNLVTKAGDPPDSVAPERLRIGARVQVVFAERDGIVLPQWVLERS
ncbi:Zn-ribbon domain-containing OB-fold protein [Streptomyces flavofungini]|uniref:Zn-ribbon domain-containing OB-fold protein n=1 Tax=Streptomyces flavofungini TaxID=68200 RepID=UPI0025B2628F|nr:OB-fold domain-containing protein [Streptomyces flavofungini]WJV48068.1 OB-fold domain-containing protein [Streptomyces flavofungini]